MTASLIKAFLLCRSPGLRDLGVLPGGPGDEGGPPLWGLLSRNTPAGGTPPKEAGRKIRNRQFDGRAMAELTLGIAGDQQDALSGGTCDRSVPFRPTRIVAHASPAFFACFLPPTVLTSLRTLKTKSDRLEDQPSS